MAGHSKWSKVKRSKGALDVKRGQLFSKLSKEISVAAKMGGGDPDGNPRLRSAVLAARAQSMPNDNIERAIQRGTGEGPDAQVFEELIYEGYAPGGVALLVEVATDNRNRTAADLRLIFSKHHGHLGSSGSVRHLFQRKGQINLPRATIEEDRLLEFVIEAAAEELTTDEEQHVITTSHDRLYAVAEALKNAGVATDAQRLTYLPETEVVIADESQAAQIVRLCEALEENDDVQNVYSNFDMPEELLAKVSA